MIKLKSWNVKSNNKSIHSKNQSSSDSDHPVLHFRRCQWTSQLVELFLSICPWNHRLRFLYKFINAYRVTETRNYWVIVYQQIFNPSQNLNFEQNSCQKWCFFSGFTFMKSRKFGVLNLIPRNYHVAKYKWSKVGVKGAPGSKVTYGGMVVL